MCLGFQGIKQQVTWSTNETSNENKINPRLRPSIHPSIHACMHTCIRACMLASRISERAACRTPAASSCLPASHLLARSLVGFLSSSILIIIIAVDTGRNATFCCANMHERKPSIFTAKGHLTSCAFSHLHKFNLAVIDPSGEGMSERILIWFSALLCSSSPAPPSPASLASRDVDKTSVDYPAPSFYKSRETSSK